MHYIPVVRLKMIRESTFPAESRQITSPADTFAFIHDMLNDEASEQMLAILLNTQGRVTGVHRIYSGSLNACVVRVGEIFRAAILSNSSNIILVHNHPSGNPTPSPEDHEVTQLVKQAGALLDIPLTDHIIIGQNGYFSFLEKGFIKTMWRP